MWDRVIQAASDMAAADGILINLYPTMRNAGPGKHSVPLLEHRLIADSEDELWSPVVIQWDQWHESMAAIIAGERQLRLLFHVETQRDYAGIPMWSQYVDAEWIASPDRDGYFGRAIRFRMTPLRERYQHPVP